MIVFSVFNDVVGPVMRGPSRKLAALKGKSCENGGFHRNSAPLRPKICRSGGCAVCAPRSLEARPRSASHRSRSLLRWVFDPIDGRAGRPKLLPWRLLGELLLQHDRIGHGYGRIRRGIIELPAHIGRLLEIIEPRRDHNRRQP